LRLLAATAQTIDPLHAVRPLLRAAAARWRQSQRLEFHLFPTPYLARLNVILSHAVNTNFVFQVLHGDGWSRFNYTRVPTVTHSERDMEYRWEYTHSGGLLVEERIDFGSVTGLSNAKISYDYDENYRLIGLSGRIGGQNLPEYNLAYSPLTGALQQIGQFQVFAAP